MHAMTRRRLLGAAAATTLAGALAGCSTLTNLFGNQTAAQIQADVQAIASGLTGVLAALQSVPGVSISADVQAKIAAEIALINANAAQIASAVTPSASTLQTIAQAVGVVATLVTPFFPAAPAVAAVINAAVSLIGVVLANAGVTPAPALAKAAPGFRAMSPDQARAILNNAALNGVH